MDKDALSCFLLDKSTFLDLKFFVANTVSSWDSTEGTFLDTEAFLLDKSTCLDLKFFVVNMWLDSEFLRVLRAVFVV